MLMEGETPGAQDSTGAALRSSGVERDPLNTADTQGSLSTVHCESCSPVSSPPLSGSAVSALESKFKKITQRRCKRDQVPEASLEEQELRKRSSSSEEEGPEPPPKEACQKREKEGSTAVVASLPRGVGEGSSLENIATGGADTSVPSKPTSSSRHWAPPKGFWRVARPETLLLNGEGASSLVASPPKNEENLQRRQRLRAQRAAARKELQRADSLESTFRRCFQKEAESVDPQGDLWRADSWETVCSRRGSQMEERSPERGKSKTTESTTGRRAEGQHQWELLHRGESPFSA